MFKIGLENRDFCKSLHFYIVDAGKKKKKKKKKKRAASAGLFSCSRPFGPRTSPFGRCPHYLFFLCCGALASALIVDAGKKKKKRKKKEKKKKKKRAASGCWHYIKSRAEELTYSRHWGKMGCGACQRPDTTRESF